MKLFWRSQRCQWENYVNDAHHDLSGVDEQIFSLLSPYQCAFEGDSRREKVLNAIIKRACVDNHPDIARLRNRLDDWDNYTDGIQPSSKQISVSFRQQLGERMREDVLELMRQRQCHARKQGFGSYPELVLWSEDLALKPVHALLSVKIATSLPVAASLAKNYGITWSSWFNILNSIGYQSDFAGSTSLVLNVLKQLGFNSLSSTISVVVKDQPIAGFAGIITVPDDIRILISPITGLHQELALYHELGHAIAHAMNRETGIFKTWTSAYDEAMAVVFERIAAWIVLDDEQKKAAQDLWLLEETRCATSALFEMELWEHPQAAEDLYLQHYRAWDIETLPAGVWAADSFRSIDPIYIHNYVIAAEVADITIEFLKHKFGDNFTEWGQWLAENYYAEGRGRTLEGKVTAVGGLACLAHIGEM